MPITLPSEELLPHLIHGILENLNRLGNAEFRVWSFVAAKLIEQGMQKLPMTYDELSQGSGLSRKSLSVALQSLERQDLLIIRRSSGKRQTSTYSVPRLSSLVTQQSREAVLQEEVRLWKKIVEGLEWLEQTIQEMPVSPSGGITGHYASQNQAAIQEGGESSQAHLKQWMEMDRLGPVLNHITYIQAAPPYCTIYFDIKHEQNLELRVSLKQLANYFQDSPLVRIHKSHMVHAHKVLAARRKSKSDYEVYLKDLSGSTIPLPIGRAFLSILQSQYSNWFHE